MKSNAHKKGLIFAGGHTLLFFLMIIYIKSSNDGQAPLVLVFFAFIDFPISLIYFVPHEIFNNLRTLYSPYIIHGLFGGIWWYLVPRLFMPKRLGGIWGKRQKEIEA